MMTKSVLSQQLELYETGQLEIKELIGMTPELFEQLKGRAQYFLDGKHYERALIMLEMIEELDRTDWLPTLLAIEVLLKLGRSDAAENKVTLLLQRDANDARALVAKAELLLHTGELNAAAQILKKVLDEDPSALSEAGRRARAVAAHGRAMLEGAKPKMNPGVSNKSLLRKASWG